MQLYAVRLVCRTRCLDPGPGVVHAVIHVLGYFMVVQTNLDMGPSMERELATPNPACVPYACCAVLCKVSCQMHLILLVQCTGLGGR